MSDTLPTFIAFVGFLIVFSMLVQAVQEGFKNLLKLKAGVWERFFLNIYKNEFSLAKGEPTSLLKFREREFVGDFKTRMSRLKDIMVAADTELKSLKDTLSQIVQCGPADISCLSSLAVKLSGHTQRVTGLKIDALLNIYDRIDANAIANFVQALKEFSTKHPKLVSGLSTAQQNIVLGFQSSCAGLLSQIDTIELKVADYRAQIENKLDAWIAQLNEEYRRNMLLWTVLTGSLLVAVFNADSFTIYRHLSVDSKAQAALIQKAAEEGSKTMITTSEAISRMNALLRDKNTEEARKQILAISQSLEKDYTTFGSTNGAQAAALVNLATNSISTSEPDRVWSGLEKQAGELSRLYVALQKTSIDYQFQGIIGLGLPLGWIDDLKAISSLSGCDFAIWLLKKLSGLMLTAFLVTFGAPFWNDILSALTGLKQRALNK